jgi:hypothetical protein
MGKQWIVYAEIDETGRPVELPGGVVKVREIARVEIGDRQRPLTAAERDAYADACARATNVSFTELEPDPEPEPAAAASGVAADPEPMPRPRGRR